MKNRAVATWMLDVPPLPCVVDAHGQDRAFDAWSWCPSDVLEVRASMGMGTPHGDGDGDQDDASPIWQVPRLQGHNPPGLAFVMRQECALLPRELARLHAFGYGLADELALAPWAIDDATDLLYEHRLRPRDVFWLAASSLEALVWGLHDWAHFHNHGPFDQPAMTELQCDLIALAWLRQNAERLGVGEPHLSAVAGDLAALSSARFREEKRPEPVGDLRALFEAPYSQAAIHFAAR